jgi:hypothetical protein
MIWGIVVVLSLKASLVFILVRIAIRLRNNAFAATDAQQPRPGRQPAGSLGTIQTIGDRRRDHFGQLDL